jgi:Arylsulfotransferase (ASST)
MSASLTLRRAAVLAGVWLLAGVLAARVSAQLLPAKARAGKPVGLDVQPFPGTPDVSPQTDVGFPALLPSQIRAVRVDGSASGPHLGRLSAAPGHIGAVFVPDRPFVSGERVSVEAILGSPAAGAASGAPGRTRLRFSFGVQSPLRTPSAATSVGTDPTAAYAIRHDIRESRTWTHTFRSIRRIHPPLVFTSGGEPDAGSGDIFTDVHRAYRQAGPLILDPQGGLIWFNPIPNRAAAFNTQVQRYRGRQVLTYWQGHTSPCGFGSGEDVILDHHYRRIVTVRAGHGYHADLHEFRILPNGDALITAYANVPGVDLRAVGGPKNGILLDSIIQEINIATGRVVWEWHAYGHVRLSETYAGKPSGCPYDFFHVNSIQMLRGGRLLVSARNEWTVYEIKMKTGRIAYNFGGKNSSFRFGPGAHFEWQHHATMQSDGTMTVFDNGAGSYKVERHSRALRLRIDYGKRRVALVRAYMHRPPLLAGSQGSVQVLKDGNVFVGWGSARYLSEFENRGGQLFSMHYHSPMVPYRGFRFSWWGQPATRPNLATVATKRGTRVYASWNGVTDVSTWRVLAGHSQHHLKAVETFPKTDFETTMWVRRSAAFFAVQALGPAGRVRATSRAVARGRAG